MGIFLEKQLVGYIFGIIVSSSRIGKGVMVPYEGLALQEDTSSKIIRLLYAKVSQEWIEQGCYQHSITVPLGVKCYYEAFIQLSFAMEQVYGVLSLADYKPFKTEGDIKIRFANEDDRESLVEMSGIIALHQNESPVYIPVPDEYLKSLQRGFASLVDGDDVVLLAVSQNEVLGYLVLEELDATIMVPNHCVELNVAATKPVYAGYAFSQMAGSLATIVKLTRTLFIVPIVLIFSWIYLRSERNIPKSLEKENVNIKKIFPWFILGFLLFVGIRSMNILNDSTIHVMSDSSRFLMTMAFAAIGLKTSFNEVKGLGFKPMLSAVIIDISVVLVSFLVLFFMF